MTRLRTRLFLTIFTITFVVIASLGFMIGQMFKDYYFEHLANRIEKEADLAAYSIIQHGFYRQDMQQMAREISDHLETRITIIDADGTVLGESATNINKLDNHLMRPEIESLKAGERHEEIRYSETLGYESLYMTSALMADEEIIGFLRIGIPLREINHVIKNVWLMLGVCFALAFVLILSLIYRVANQMIAPVEEATVVANGLAKGNYYLRAKEGRSDEIGQLSKSINVLATNLETMTKRQQLQQEQMETLIENIGSGLLLINLRGDIVLINRACRHIFQENTDVWIDRLYYDVIIHEEINEIVQTIFMKEEVAKRQVILPSGEGIRHFDVYGAPILSNERKLKGVALILHDITELKKLEQVRKDFVANVSHELKTPVTSIKGFTETLLDGAMENAELCEKFLTIIDKESERLQTLLSELLELSKIEQHEFPLQMISLNIVEVAHEVFELLKGKAEEKGVLLHVEEQKEGAYIEGDVARIKQVIINLVNNAIMYTQKHGAVHIKIEEEKEDVKLIISDNGIGIPKSEIPRLFERFYRVDRARSRNSGGTGLGLAIVKHLVEVHRGRIEVKSELGEGSTFTIYFPKVASESTVFNHE